MALWWGLLFVFVAIIGFSPDLHYQEINTYGEYARFIRVDLPSRVAIEVVLYVTFILISRIRDAAEVAEIVEPRCDADSMSATTSEVPVNL